MEFSLCIDSIYPEDGLKEKLERIKQAGFKFIEFWDWRDKDFELIINSGLKITNFSGNRVSSLTLDNKEKIIQEVNASIDIAKRLKCDRIMLLSDVLENDGSVKNNSISSEKKLLRLYDNLKALAEIAEERDIKLVIEPLNSLKDHKNYYLDNFQKTLELIQLVNSEHLKILYDIYHMQIMEGNILDTLQKYHQFIGYIHIANVPYRCEPWIGELDFKFILKELSKVYSEFVGFEFFVKEKSFTYKKLYDWIQSIN
ncbi:MAG: TIM barrel protein, partial [Candidatus Caldatribacteriota bacterium]|nr:TIM barrel protein [Candidatus Caldatribacteriota bacterium]